MTVTVTNENVPGAPPSWSRYVVRVDGRRVGAHETAAAAQSQKASLEGRSNRDWEKNPPTRVN